MEAFKGMLETYAEIVDEARAKPGAHATVDFLLDFVERGEFRFVCQMDDKYFSE